MCYYSVYARLRRHKQHSALPYLFRPKQGLQTVWGAWETSNSIQLHTKCQRSTCLHHSSSAAFVTEKDTHSRIPICGATRLASSCRATLAAWHKTEKKCRGWRRSGKCEGQAKPADELLALSLDQPAFDERYVTRKLRGSRTAWGQETKKAYISVGRSPSWRRLRVFGSSSLFW